MNNSNHDKKIIVLYARSDMRNQKYSGVKNQIADIKKYAKKNGCTIEKMYVDDGYSGRDLNRPGLSQLLLDVKDKKWQMLVVTDWNRLSRDPNVSRLIEAKLEQAGAKVVTITPRYAAYIRKSTDKNVDARNSIKNQQLSN